jgi:hypothetical protein
MPQGTPEPLAQAYRAAVYRAIDAGGVWHAFSFDAHAPGDEPGTLPFKAPWAIVTACNPRSVRRCEAHNAAAMQRLDAALRSLGVQPRDAEAHEPDGPGPWRESSLLAQGLELDRAAHLLRVFQQHACVYCAAGRIGLLHADTASWEVLPLRLR